MPRLFLRLSLLAVLVACGPSAVPAPAPAASGGATDGRGRAEPDNPYLAREGEPLTPIKVGTCVVSGSNLHLNTALRANLFPKYGLDVQHVFISGAAISLGALANNDIQFLYCGPEGTL